jgi:putative protease
MEILAPFDGIEQIPMLAKAGATELYCGYIPLDWVEEYNRKLPNLNPYKLQISLNRRESHHANLISRQALKAAVDKANELGLPVYVTVNAPFYATENYPFILNYVEAIVAAGAEGMMIADPGLMWAIREAGIKTKVVLSTCTQVANVLANRFFKELGVRRITFPRHVSLAEVAAITRHEPDLEYECFVLEGRCTYDDGHCHTLHCGGSICNEEWLSGFLDVNGRGLDFGEGLRLKRHHESYRDYINPWPNDRTNRNGWRNMGCGICAIPYLLEHTNMSTLKVAGRGIDNLQKLKSIFILSRALNMALEGASGREIREMAQADLQPYPELCETNDRCYFPDGRVLYEEVRYRSKRSCKN